MKTKNNNNCYPKIPKNKKARKTQEHPQNQEQENEEERDEEDNNKGFYACYLLTSLCPRFKGHTYIGFTVNPQRRIRQHNGEIRCGAFRTKKRRPWEMVLCLYGFPSNVSALQFEWAWQHPTESLAVRQAAATFKSFSGVANKIKLAYTMLNLPSWQSLNITVNYFSTKYATLAAGSPCLPDHMNVQVCSMDELPCYIKTGENWSERKYPKIGFDHEDELHCYTEIDEDLFEGKDAETGWDGEDEHKESSNVSEAVKVNTVEVLASPMNLPVTTAAPILTSSSMGQTKKRDTPALIYKSVYELDWSAGKEFISKAAPADDGHLIQSSTVPCKIEVIDLLSPSPERRIGANNKKRRVSLVCPIIDLT